MGLFRKAFVGVILIVIIVAGVAVGGYYAGVFGKPAGGVEDMGDWGEVTEQRTEIITTLWVKNPNPIGVNIGEGVSTSYSIWLNDIRLAEGQKEGISITSGRDTIDISSFVINDNLPPWWVAYVQNNETIRVRATGDIQINAGVTTSVDIPEQERTMLRDSTPVISALSSAASGLEGEYVGSATIETGPASEEVTAGIEVQRGWATWGEVTEDRTEVLFHLQVHNPGDIPMPAAPDGIGVSVDMNEVRLFRAQTDALSLQNIDSDAVIKPGETREIVFKVSMDNQQIDEWFTSHVANDEQSQIAVQLQLVFEISEIGMTIRMPQEGGLTYTCDLQTAILEDNQETTTNCGEGGEISIG